MGVLSGDTMSGCHWNRSAAFTIRCPYHYLFSPPKKNYGVPVPTRTAGAPLSHPIRNLLPSDRDDVLDSGTGENGKILGAITAGIEERNPEGEVRVAGQGNFRTGMMGIGM